MPTRSGTADLPLHGGRVPQWLASRMATPFQLIFVRQPDYSRPARESSGMTVPIGKQVELKIAGKTYKVAIKSLGRNGAEVEVDGKEYHVDIQVPAQPGRTPTSRPAARPASRPVKPVEPRPAPPTAKSLNSLMPGTVLKILVKPGQQVAAGDVLLVLEAMKMENEIRSDRSGTIGSINVSEGQQVQTGEPLVSFS